MSEKPQLYPESFRHVLEGWKLEKGRLQLSTDRGDLGTLKGGHVLGRVVFIIVRERLDRVGHELVHLAIFVKPRLFLFGKLAPANQMNDLLLSTYFDRQI